MWLSNKPTRVHATPESVKKDYEILKKNLPIPLGIDHLDDATIEKNPILKKMNLLNVGSVKDVKLENNLLKITDSEITNPVIRKLYDDGELQSFSNIASMFTSKCRTGKADAVEEFSVINRVDFVGNGACKTCKVDLPVDYSSIPQRAEAKAIIENGDESMAADPNANPAPDAGKGTPNPDDGSQNEPTMQDVLKAVTDLTGVLKPALAAIEGKLGIKEATPQTPEQPPAAPAAASEPEGEPASAEEARITALENEVKASKARAEKAEASAVVDKYLKEGKVKPAQIETHVAMAMATPEQYNELMKEAPVIIDMERHSAQASGSDSTGLTDEEGEEINLEETSKEMDKLIGDA